MVDVGKLGPLVGVLEIMLEGPVRGEHFIAEPAGADDHEGQGLAFEGSEPAGVLTFLRVNSGHSFDGDPRARSLPSLIVDGRVPGDEVLQDQGTVVDSGRGQHNHAWRQPPHDGQEPAGKYPEPARNSGDDPAGHRASHAGSDRLFYATQDQPPFADEITAITTGTSVRLHLHHSTTQGYLTPTQVLHAVDGTDPRELSLFLCGPEPMVSSFVRHFRKAGVPARNIHREHFDWR